MSDRADPLHPDTVDPLISAEQVRARVEAIAEQIARDYAGRSLTVVCVLKGGFVFVADLIRRLPLRLHLDFIEASSYGSQTQSSGHVHLGQDISLDIRDHDVLIVDDILDTGRTLRKVIDRIQEQHPRSCKVCVLLRKQRGRTGEVEADYFGFDVPDRFVVGFGLDFNDEYRNLPFIGVLKA